MIVALTVAGALLRFLTLGGSIWFDEGLTVFDVNGSLSHLARSIDHNELHPPLYFGLLWLWRHAVGSSVVALRALSAVSGTALIPVAYLAGRRLIGVRTGMIAAAITASDPMLVYYSQELRPYALLAGLCGLSLLLFDVLLRGDLRRRTVVAWTVCSALALFTQYQAWLVVAPETAVALCLVIRGRWPWPIGLSVAAIAVVQAAIAVLALHQYAPQYRYLGEQLSSAVVHVVFRPEYAAITNSFPELEQNLALGPGGPAKSLCVTLVLVSAMGAIVLLALGGRTPERLRRLRGPVALLVLGVIFTAASFALPTAIRARYLLPLWLPAVVVLAAGFASAPRLGAAWATALCLLGTAVSVISAVDPRHAAREDVRSAARALGTSQVLRLIAIDQAWDLVPLRVYRPRAQPAGAATVSVREIDLIATPNGGRLFPYGVDHPAAVAPSVGLLPQGFVRVKVERTATDLVERFRAAHPIAVPLAPRAGPFTNGWRFLLEAPGARPSVS